MTIKFSCLVTKKRKENFEVITEQIMKIILDLLPFTFTSSFLRPSPIFISPSYSFLYACKRKFIIVLYPHFLWVALRCVCALRNRKKKLYLLDNDFCKCSLIFRYKVVTAAHVMWIWKLEKSVYRNVYCSLMTAIKIFLYM